MLLNALALCKILFTNGGVQRGFAPLPGVWGCPPISKFPQDWGIKGVEKGLINDLSI